MAADPGFDPYALLGVSVDADEVVIQLAYRARIREAHPDRAGAAGLERAKQLNVARDWLLDPERRALLVGPSPDGPAGYAGPPRRDAARARRTTPRPPRPSAVPRPDVDPAAIDPFRFDFGPPTAELRAFLSSIPAISPDERARVNYALGDERALDFDDYRDYIEPSLWFRSLVLREAVAAAWRHGHDEKAPDVPLLGRLVPSGALVANAYAQWLLLGDFFERELGPNVLRGDDVIAAFTARCLGPWTASVGQPRYGPYDAEVKSFLTAATSLSRDAARRLSRAWQRQLGRDGQHHRPHDRIGAGVWLPAPSTYPESQRVSGYLAAVDASRIPPPPGLDAEDHEGFRHGLRLTAHVVAIGPVDDVMYSYLRPWQAAFGA